MCFFALLILKLNSRLLMEEIIPALRQTLTEEEFDEMIYQHDGSPIQYVE